MPRKEEGKGIVAEERWRDTGSLSPRELEIITELDEMDYLNNRIDSLKIVSEYLDEIKFRVFRMPSWVFGGPTRFVARVSRNEKSRQQILEEFEGLVPFPFILSGNVLIFPCYKMEEEAGLSFEQEGLFLNFLIDYYRRVGGEIIYRSDMLDIVGSSVKDTKCKSEVTSEEISYAIFNSWKRQREFYRGGMGQGIKEVAQRLSKYPSSDLSSSLQIFSPNLEVYFKSIVPEKIKLERALFGDGYPCVTRGIMNIYLLGLKDALESKPGNQ